MMFITTPPVPYFSLFVLAGMSEGGNEVMLHIYITALGGLDVEEADLKGAKNSAENVTFRKFFILCFRELCVFRIVLLHYYPSAYSHKKNDKDGNK